MGYTAAEKTADRVSDAGMEDLPRLGIGVQVGVEFGLDEIGIEVLELPLQRRPAHDAAVLQ